MGTLLPLGFGSPQVGSSGGTLLARHGRQIEPKTDMQQDENTFTGSGIIWTSSISSNSSESVVYHPELTTNATIIHFIVSVEQLSKMPVNHH